MATYNDPALEALRERFNPTQSVFGDGSRGNRAQHYIDAIGDLLAHRDFQGALNTDAWRAVSGRGSIGASDEPMQANADVLTGASEGLTQRLGHNPAKLPRVMRWTTEIQKAAGNLMRDINDYQKLRSSLPNFPHDLAAGTADAV